MPKVARQVSSGDLVATGHPCDSTTNIQQHSPNVYACGHQVSRQDDVLVVHNILIGDKCVPHTSKVNQGSNTVYANGEKLARIGDSADAGQIITGAPTVFAGG